MFLRNMECLYADEIEKVKNKNEIYGNRSKDLGGHYVEIKAI